MRYECLTLSEGDSWEGEKCMQSVYMYRILSKNSASPIFQPPFTK